MVELRQEFLPYHDSYESVALQKNIPIWTYLQRLMNAIRIHERKGDETGSDSIIFSVPPAQIGNRASILQGVSKGKLALLPGAEAGNFVPNDQISIVRIQVLSTGSAWFGNLAPAHARSAGNPGLFPLYVPVPIGAMIGAVFACFSGMLFVIGRMEGLLWKVLKVKSGN